MKIGSTFPVTVEGHHVCDAVVEEIYDGKATLFIPNTRIVMKVNTSLGGPPDPEVDHVVGTQPQHELSDDDYVGEEEFRAGTEVEITGKREVRLEEPQSLKDMDLNDDI